MLDCALDTGGGNISSRVDVRTCAPGSWSWSLSANCSTVTDSSGIFPSMLSFPSPSISRDSSAGAASELSAPVTAPLDNRRRRKSRIEPSPSFLLFWDEISGTESWRPGVELDWGI
ncbi:hypothetical protein M427DRAFT_57268, partial [Gonapodya prolifera JEL478]